MIQIIAHWQAKEGHEQQAADALAEMYAYIQGEPGTLLYIVHHDLLGTAPPPPKDLASNPPRPPREIVFWEVYQDDDAFKTHVDTMIAYMRDHELLQHFTLPNPDAELPTFAVEVLHQAAGFVRSSFARAHGPELMEAASLERAPSATSDRT